MKRFYLFLFVLLCCYGCSSGTKTDKQRFEDYPVYEGVWEEMNYTPQRTEFSLWSPAAQEVRVMLYEEGQGGSPYKMLTMTSEEDGMWKTEFEGDLAGKFYAFNVKIDDVWQGDTPGVMAKAVGVNGERAAVIDMRKTDPAGWASDTRPPLKSFADIVIYEMHHRDFSMDTTLQIKHRGKFLALTDDSACVRSTGEPAGLAHLRALGVTHVHLLPSFDFASVDETKLDVPQYNWGYDPKNYNVPDGSYSTDPYRPEVRIREFKQMVQALHRAGIRVILDVVYNHTYDLKTSNFERTVPGYFYRHEGEQPCNASGCGNETASERPMMRKFMIESVKYWVNEYHIDGFRFDLMGIHDIETMNAIRRELDAIDPTIFVYGEGWAAGAPSLPADELAMKANMKRLPRIAAFSDELRDSLRGAWGDDSKGAFIVGKPGHEAGVKFGVVGGIEHPQLNKNTKQHINVWAQEPVQFISYVSCHDDLCVTDRLKSTRPGIQPKEQSALLKLAYTSVLTSQGVPFIFAGDEVMRDKKGVHNSYKSPDDINAIPWINKSLHKDVYDYISGLIHMRRRHPAFRLGSAESVRRHVEFLPVDNHSNVVAYRIKDYPNGDTWGNIIIVLNARTEPVTISIPDGKYWVVCRDGKIDLVMGLGNVSGNSVTVSPQSALIIRQ